MSLESGPGDARWTGRGWGLIALGLGRPTHGTYMRHGGLWCATGERGLG
jgi:hypothetical protein